MKAFERRIPGLVDLHDRVARPNIKAISPANAGLPSMRRGFSGATGSWTVETRIHLPSSRRKREGVLH